MPKISRTQKSPRPVITSLLGKYVRNKSDLRYFAMICPVVWQYSITGSVIAASPSYILWYYAGRSIFSLVVLGYFFFRRPSLEHWWSKLSWPLEIATCVTPFIAFLCPHVHGLVAAASCLGGAGSCWLYFLIARMYKDIDARSMSFFLFMSLTVGMLFWFLPYPAILIVASPLPLVCVLCCNKAVALHRNAPPANEQGSRVTKDYWPIVLQLALYGIVIGFLRIPVEEQRFSNATSALCQVFTISVCLFLFWWVVVRNKRINAIRIGQVTLLFILAILLVVSLAGSMSGPALAAVPMFGRYGVYILLLFVSFCLVGQADIHPFVVFGVGWSCFMTSTLLGMVVSMVADLPFLTASVALNLSFLLVATAVFINMHTKSDRGYFLNERTKDSPPLDYDSIDTRCVSLGQQHELTHRELEVMQLICKGRSKSWIAQHLFISENTVRGYAKAVYQKTGVHSRQELLTLIGCE